MDHNNFDNSELKKEIFSLHDSWEDSLIKKESPQQNESPHCKCDLHGTSCPSMTDSPHMHGTPLAPVNERALPPNISNHPKCCINGNRDKSNAQNY